MTQLEIKIDISKGQNKKYLIQELEKQFEETLLMLQHQLGLKDPVPGYKLPFVDRSLFQRNDSRFRAFQKTALHPNKQSEEAYKNDQSSCSNSVCCKCRL